MMDIALLIAAGLICMSLLACLAIGAWVLLQMALGNIPHQEGD